MHNAPIKMAVLQTILDAVEMLNKLAARASDSERDEITQMASRLTNMAKSL